MLLVAGKPQEKVSFKMGFTPFRSKQTFWSNEIALPVDGAQKPKANPRLAPGQEYFTYNYGFKDLSPDGKHVLTSEGMWSLDEKKWVWQTWFWPGYMGANDPLPVYLALFTPDGKNIVAWRQAYEAPGPKTNKLWVVESATGKTIKTIETDYTWNSNCLALSSDGKQVFLGGGDWQNRWVGGDWQENGWAGGFQVWDLVQGKKVREFGPGSSPMTVFPDGKHLCCVYSINNQERILQFWDVTAGKELWHRDKSGAYVLAFTPNGNHVMSVDGTFVEIRDMKTGKVLESLDVGTGISSAVFDKSGKNVLVGNDAGTARLWNLEQRTATVTFEAGANTTRSWGGRSGVC